jgi:hypothetical protein
MKKKNKIKKDSAFPNQKQIVIDNPRQTTVNYWSALWKKYNNKGILQDVKYYRLN